MSIWLQAAYRTLPPPDKTDKTDKIDLELHNSGYEQPEIGVLSVKSVLSAPSLCADACREATADFPVVLENRCQRQAGQICAVSEDNQRVRNPDARFLVPNVIAFRPQLDPIEPQPGDVEAYAVALRRDGPCGYGGIAMTLGWGVTRASAAEAELRKSGRIAYDRTGRGTLIERSGNDD